MKRCMKLALRWAIPLAGIGLPGVGAAAAMPAPLEQVAREPGDAVLPGGSYRDSCTDFSFDLATGWLAARCLDRRGKLQQSTVNVLRACAQDSPLSNRDGRLVCDHPAGHPVIASGR